MIGVDVIGQIRRPYFEHQRPIKDIVRMVDRKLEVIGHKNLVRCDCAPCGT